MHLLIYCEQTSAGDKVGECGRSHIRISVISANWPVLAVQLAGVVGDDKIKHPSAIKWVKCSSGWCQPQCACPGSLRGMNLLWSRSMLIRGTLCKCQEGWLKFHISYISCLRERFSGNSWEICQIANNLHTLVFKRTTLIRTFTFPLPRPLELSADEDCSRGKFHHKSGSQSLNE